MWLPLWWCGRSRAARCGRSCARRVPEMMPTTVSNRRRRPGKVAAKVLRVVRERRRLLAIKAELEADYQAELAELQRIHARRVAQIELRDVDHGLNPQPLRDDGYPPDSSGGTR